MSSRRSLHSPRRRASHNKRQIRLVVFFFIAIISVSAAMVLFFNSSLVRISSISVEGGYNELNAHVQSVVSKSISGDYFWFIPKDSYFFFSSKNLSQSIPREFPRIAKVSLSRKGLTAVAVTIYERSPYAIACMTSGNGDCYYADKDGIIFQSASSTQGAYIVYYVTLPDNTNPIGIDFLDGDRLTAIGSFVGALAKLGFVDENVAISTSTNYDLSLEYSKAGIVSSSTPIMHLMVDESRSFEETLEDFSAFWQEHVRTATTTDMPYLSYVDMRYGNNIIYKTR